MVKDLYFSLPLWLKWRKCKNLTKNDLVKIFTIVGMHKPMKVKVFSCQGFQIDFDSNKEISKVKVYNDTKLCEYNITSKKIEFEYMKNIENDEKIKITTQLNNEKTNMEISFFNEQGNVFLDIAFPKFFEVLYDGKELLEDLIQYSKEKEAKEIVYYLQNKLNKKTKVDISKVKVEITNNKGKWIYKGKILKEVFYEMNTKSEKRIYRIVKGKFDFSRIEVINKKKKLLFYMAMFPTEGTVHLSINQTPETMRLFQCIKNISRNKFKSFEMKKDEHIECIITVNKITPKLKKFLQLEEDKARKIYFQGS